MRIPRAHKFGKDRGNHKLKYGSRIDGEVADIGPFLLEMRSNPLYGYRTLQSLSWVASSNCISDYRARVGHRSLQFYTTTSQIKAHLLPPDESEFHLSLIYPSLAGRALRLPGRGEWYKSHWKRHYLSYIVYLSSSRFL